MDQSNSTAALVVLQGDSASTQRLTGYFSKAELDIGWLKEAATNTEAARDGLRRPIRHWAAECEQLRRANAGLSSEIVARRRAEGELKEACRRKDELLAMVAHELRNPLNAIQGALEIVGHREANSETLEVARGMIGRQVRNISRLIDDLLDVSRITQGKLALRKQIVSLGAAVENAIDTCLPLIKSRQHTIEVNVRKEPILLEADSGRLEQVLSNLLNNAAKYMEPGGRLSITAAIESGQAVLRIKDAGMGMTEETLSKVFDLFVQADTSLEHFQGGLGIGLALVKNLVELHGGTVKAESEGLGRGSEFTVRLPAWSAIVTDQRRRHATYQQGVQMGISVVDDKRRETDCLAMPLKLSSHEYCATYRGDEALRAASAFPLEAALLDIGLPGRDGYQLASQA